MKADQVDSTKTMHSFAALSTRGAHKRGNEMEYRKQLLFLPIFVEGISSRETLFFKMFTFTQNSVRAGMGLDCFDGKCVCLEFPF
jgi:hypothetical protein